MSINITPWPPTQHDVERQQSGQPMLCDTARTLSANNAIYEAWINGQGQIVNQPSPVKNPSGSFGHDHSGGIYGRPLFRTVATIDLASTGFTGASLTTNPNLLEIQTDADTDANQSLEYSPRWPIWIPPCDPGETGAYTNCGLAFSYEQTSTVSGDVVTFTIRNVSAGGSAAFTLTEGASTSDFVYSTSVAQTLPCIPGAVNILQCILDVDRQGTGSSRVCYVLLYQLELGVYSA